MAIEMIMPKVDMDQESGSVVEWLKTDGDAVEEGEVILVIETDKVAIDVEAPGTGILQGISAHSGDVVPIGTVIAYILEEGEALPVRPKEPSAGKPTQPPHGASTGTDEETSADPRTEQDPFQRPARKELIIASPAARRAARLKGVDLSLVRGTGPRGRIQISDIENFSAAAPVERGESIPLVGMRRRIAERMTASYQTIPHIQFTARARMANFNKVREELNRTALKQEHKVSVTALLVKLVGMVIADHPIINSSLVDDHIQLHQTINIGIAVALEEGLIVPVLRNADQKGIRSLAAETLDLVSRARNQALQNSDVKGGTFTITNLGPFGVEQFQAIINPPQAAILAVGATTQEVVALPDRAISVQPVMRFTLAADHRIIDGAAAARFIADLKAILENPPLEEDLSP